jgi:hypothetical protein
MVYKRSGLEFFNFQYVQKYCFIKPILFFLILLLIMTKTYAQTGINFQGVARTNNNIILASQDITIKLSILKGSAMGTAEYTEIRKVTTNAQGLFTAVIGDTGAISTLGNFNTINWKLSPKFLKIEMDPAAGNNFIIMGTTQFQYVAYAQFAKSVDAENIVGILPVSKGGTGLSTIAELKAALALDKINNTADMDKPISAKTQAALDLISVTATDTARFLKRIDSKADTADVSVITKILGTKLNAADTIKYTKQVYSDSALLTKLKITDTSFMLSSRIARDTLNLSKRINLKANSTDLSLGLELKENISNKSTASDLGGTSPSDVLFPTQKAVKDYVTANAGSGGVADGGITNLKLADGAVTFAKFQNIPTNSILGNTSSSTTSVQAIATTGSDNVVLSTSPTINSPILITPNLGAATASSINNVTINGFNFKSDVPSLTITGTTTLIGNNSGDNAINTRYESLATNGVVDIVSAQNIIGEKSFSSNLFMSNLTGAGTNSPTTINFANGSMIGDIQNIHEDNPDNDGSIDLYAPDGAKWVQLNYDDINYIGLGYNRAFIEVGGNYWKFKNTGTTDLPGDLNLTDNHAINFINSGTSSPTTDASIESSGPLLRIKSRDITLQEIQDDVDYGIQINFADKSKIELYDEYINYGIIDTANKRFSNYLLSQNGLSFSFVDEVQSFHNIWNFYGDEGSSGFPGEINVHKGDVSINDGNLNLVQGKFKANNTIGTEGDVLAINSNGFPVWQAPTGGLGGGISSINGISSGTQSLTVEISNTATAPSINSDPITSIHSLSLPMASANSVTAGLLSKTDYDLFNGKQTALLNPITGTESGSFTRTSGLIPFFFGSENTITGSANLYWDATNSRLGIGTQTPNYPVQINQGGLDEFGFLISSPPPGAKSYGSSIGFESNVGGTPNSYKGSFQLDATGNMVFRTLQSDLYFDNFGNGTTFFRVGSETSNINGMTLGNTGNLEVHGSMRALSDITTSGSIKTGIFVQDQNNYVYTPTAIITAAGDMTTPGSITAQHVSAIGFTTTSDIRLKKNIIPLENTLSVINKLNPVAYDKKQNLSSVEYSIKESGFIAQELQKIMPNLVYESTDKDKLLSVNYTAIIPILTKGIQEQQAIIEDQKKRLEALEKLVNDLINKK